MDSDKIRVKLKSL